MMNIASSGRLNQNSDADDDESSNFGPNFDSSNSNNNDDGEGSSANQDGPTMNLNQAASGYPAQGDYSDVGAGFGFGPSAGEGADFDGASEGFGGEGRRAKSASSPMGARGYGGEEDAGAPLYGPNSAVNSGDGGDDEGRAGYAPEGQNDDNDDE